MTEKVYDLMVKERGRFIAWANKHWVVAGPYPMFKYTVYVIGEYGKHKVDRGYAFTRQDAIDLAKRYAQEHANREINRGRKEGEKRKAEHISYTPPFTF